MLPAISSFLNDTLVENLKKPLQPAGLFSSAVFLFLNLILFLFTPGGQEVPIVGLFLDLGTAWQLVLSSVTVLVVAYLILSLRSTIYRLMTGESWADSPVLGRFFKFMQTRALDNLEEQIRLLTEEGRTTDVYTLKKWERSIRFPDREHILPTALGNALKTTARRVWDRYGIDLATLWPYMETVIEKDQKLVTRIENEKSSLDFLVYLAFGLTVFSFEHAIVRLWLGWGGLSPVDWAAMGWSLVVLVPAYVAYRAAVNKAVSWGQAMQTGFDLYQEDLRKALGLREFKSTTHRWRVWRKMADWLVSGNLYDPKIFAVEGEPSKIVPSLVPSDNVRVQLEHSTTRERTPPGDDPASYIRGTEWINYLLIVNHADTQKTGDDQTYPAAGAHILVSDRRVPSLDYESIQILGQDCTGQIRPEIVPTGRTDSAHDLLWRIRELKPNEACVLRYRLVRSTLYEARTSDSGIVNYLMTIIIRNETTKQINDVALDVFDIRITRRQHTVLGEYSKKKDGILWPEKVGLPVSDDCFRWKLGCLPAQGSGSLTVHITS
jgi:hypothetical protein